MKKEMIVKYSDFFDLMDDGVLIYEINTEDSKNKLIYMNDQAKQILHGGCVLTKEKETLEELLQLRKDEITVLLKEVIDKGYYSSVREVYDCKNEGHKLDCKFNLLSIQGEVYLQISFLKKDKICISNKDLSVDNYVKRMVFKRGAIGLMKIKNQEGILSTFGKETVDVIYAMVLETINIHLCGYCDAVKLEEEIILIINKEYNEIESLLVKVIAETQKRILKEKSKIKPTFKVGISTYTKNKYIALHEAKFTLQKSMYHTKNVLSYIQPFKADFMEFLIKSDLPYAIEHKELQVNFQAIFNTDEADLYGFEALLRWNHSKYGSISPAEFIPIAERSDLICEIDLWAIEHALKDFHKIQKNFKRPLKINLNVSPRDFFVDSFVDDFLKIIQESEIDASNVILELTETLNLYPKKGSIEKIKNQGILIALDDFGTGFASLSQLKNYRIDFLKIDISFIRDINKDYDNTLITSAILSMAKELGISVIAEGVNEAEQFEFLRDRECGYIQGFNFHKPQNQTEILNCMETKCQEETIKNFRSNGEESLAYVEKYPYGKYIYVQISLDGKLVTINERINRLTNSEIKEGQLFETIVAEDLKKSFSLRLEDIIGKKSHVIFTSYVLSQSEEVPVVITMNYNKKDDKIDLFIEDFTKEQSNFFDVKNLYNRYDMIFDEISSAIIVTDLNYIVEEWNKGASKIFGYSRKEALGRNLIKLLVKTEEQNAISSVANKNIQDKVSYNINTNLTKDHKEIICEWQGNCIVNDSGKPIGLVSIVKDITNERIVEEKLNMVSTVVMQDPNAILITDSEGCIEFGNDAFLELTQYSSEEVIGENPRILSSGEQSKEFYEAFWESIKEGEIWIGEFRNKKKDGTLFVAESRVFSIKNQEGEIVKYVCIHKDITKEIEKDNYVKEISGTLENQERLSLIGQMAAGIIHEINNPLSYIDINVHALRDMIEEVEKGKNDQAFIEELYELNEDLSTGIEDIKNIAAGLKRFTYKSQANNFEFFSLNEEIETIIIISKNEYKYYADIHFVKETIPDIYGDSGKIKQVLLNLIINAVHAIRAVERDGFGTINIKTYEDEKYIYCSIEDNGSGISTANSNKIFEAFFTTKEKGKGTGLGLSLSKKIIEEEHKGKLYFDTKVGTGTTFYIRFDKIRKEE